jgi:hypothetical protein
VSPDAGMSCPPKLLPATRGGELPGTTLEASGTAPGQLDGAWPAARACAFSMKRGTCTHTREECCSGEMEGAHGERKYGSSTPVGKAARRRRWCGRWRSVGCSAQAARGAIEQGSGTCRQQAKSSKTAAGGLVQRCVELRKRLRKGVRGLGRRQARRGVGSRRGLTSDCSSSLVSPFSLDFSTPGAAKPIVRAQRPNTGCLAGARGGCLRLGVAVPPPSGRVLLNAANAIDGAVSVSESMAQHASMSM